MKKTITLLSIIFCLQLVGQTTRYVTEAGAGSKDGSNWANASNDLQAMINASTTAGDKIFVAKGTYKPEYKADAVTGAKTPNNRDNAFVLKDGVKIYGGFDPDNGITNLTHNRILPSSGGAGGGSILSGDIDNDDTLTNGISTTINGNNAHHVVISVTDSNATVLDGFTITGGNANGSNNITVEGTRIYGEYGGGMYNHDNSSPTITNTTFSGNTAEYGGGGMLNSGSSSPTITNTTFSGNTATRGGGMYNHDHSSPTITNTTFSGNTAIYYGGGMYNWRSSPTITNTTFSGNTATLVGGGAIRNYYSSNPKIYNSIFWDNKKSGNTNVAGADIQNVSSSAPTVERCLTQENSVHRTGTGIINNQNPLFVDAANGDFSLQASSPAIDAGNNAPTGVTMPTTDANGYARIYNTTVDMGAYEYQLNPNTGILYVKKGGAGTQNGSSWANAVGELADALKWAKVQPASVTNTLKIFVAKGTYKPLYHANNMSGADPNDRNNAFVLVNNVKVYGGFAGTETSLTQRDLSITANKTTLSGDLGTANNNSDNARHVVISVNDSNATVLDGFTITGGNASGFISIPVERSRIPGVNGGGMYNSSSSPTITNITFSGNTARNGGGMYNRSSSPTITNTTFSGNKADKAGGGIRNYDYSSPSITNTTFSGNTANRGGGMANSFSSPTITNTTFSGNTATRSGGGGMYNSSSSPTITNTTFSGNKARNGGGMYNNRSSSPKIYNSIFWDNKKNGNTNVAGADIENNSSYPTVAHSLLQLAKTDYPTTGSDRFIFATTDKNIYKQNPKFVSATNLRLQVGSPAINAGDNTKYNTATMGNKDLAGNQRIFDTTIDMGAYELQTQPQTIIVNNITKTYGDTDFSPATANSGLTVNYSSSNPKVATIVNNKIHITGAGTTKITVTQAGNATYSPAPSKTVTLTVKKANLVVTADSKTKVYDGKILPKTTYSVNYRGFVNGETKTVLNDTLNYGGTSQTAINAGMYSIIPSGLTAKNYAITFKTDSLKITKATIKGITLTDSSFVYDGKEKSLAISGTLPKGASVSYTQNNQTKAGVYKVIANIKGGINYKDLTLKATLSINKTKAVIKFNDIVKTYGDESFELKAESNSTAKITYNIVGISHGTKINDNKVTLGNAGTIKIKATVKENDAFFGASKTIKLTTKKATQTIVWEQTLRIIGCGGNNNLPLTASTSSGLPVTYESSNNFVTDILDNELSVLKPKQDEEKIVITAIQKGNINYLPAISVSKELELLVRPLIAQHFDNVIKFNNRSRLYSNWQWYRNGVKIAGATKQFYSEQQPLTGNFHVEFTDKQGNVFRSCPLKVNNRLVLQPLKLYPNPVGDLKKFTVQSSYTPKELEGATIRVIDILGRLLDIKPVEGQKTVLSAPYAPSMYIVILQLADGRESSGNLLVR